MCFQAFESTEQEVKGAVGGSSLSTFDKDDLRKEV